MDAFGSFQKFRTVVICPLYFYTSTMWNTIECCRGFQDIKDEINSSLKASDILGLIF